MSTRKARRPLSADVDSSEVPPDPASDPAVRSSTAQTRLSMGHEERKLHDLLPHHATDGILRPILFAVTSTIVMSVTFRYANENILPRDKTPPGPGAAASAVIRLAHGPWVPQCARVVQYESASAPDRVEGAPGGAETRRTFPEQMLGLILVAEVAWSYNATLVTMQNARWQYDCGTGDAWGCFFEPPVDECAQDGRATDRQPLQSVANRLVPCPTRTSVQDTALASSAASCTVAGSAADEDFALGRIALAKLHNRLEDPLPYLRRVAKTLWKLRPTVANSVDQIILQAGLNLSDNADFYGLDIRPDVADPDLPADFIQPYIAALTAVAGGVPRTVFVATESRAALSRVTAALPNSRVLCLLDTPRAGHSEQKLHGAQYIYEYERTVDLIAEMSVLQGARAFVGRFSHPVARLVQLLRADAAQTGVSVDVAWHYYPTGRGAPAVQYCEGSKASRVYCESRVSGK